MVNALGMVETRGLAASIEVVDRMLKSSNVNLLNSNVDSTRITIIVEGDLISVQDAVEIGKIIALRTGALIAANVIPHIDLDTQRLFIQ